MMILILFLDYILYMILILGSLISVAFITLMERKVLGYLQDRKGPNKVGYLGIIQPFSDAIKLFLKENVKLIKVNYLMYYFSPMINFMLAMFMLLGFLNSVNFLMMEYSLMYFLCCLSVMIYTLMIAGWASNSNYSMLGSVRSIIQALSYEISLFLIFLCLFMYIESYNLNKFIYFFNNSMLVIVNFPLSLIFFCSILADLNRIPFDLIEGESELVSGFNTEYMSGSFAMFFLGEYLMILIFSMWISLMYFSSVVISLMFMIQVFFIILIIIMLRGVLPRMRYDWMMYFCWYEILPSIMMMLYFLSIFKYYLSLIF
uniref:NADH-ubiquinone oxidoreductase chain 1 n=1 Tax=Anterhynchium (Dirhynchium) sp. QHZ-2020 TaxID=2742733 RepID=A0A6M9AUR7_9HYME|nr:NADH dehydrogenase subunit 1 [Anterhynchium (Dirhynchium) sp. QHZ-2020]